MILRDVLRYLVQIERAHCLVAVELLVVLLPVQHVLVLVGCLHVLVVERCSNTGLQDQHSIWVVFPQTDFRV